MLYCLVGGLYCLVGVVYCLVRVLYCLVAVLYCSVGVLYCLVGVLHCLVGVLNVPVFAYINSCWNVFLLSVSRVVGVLCLVVRIPSGSGCSKFC